MGGGGSEQPVPNPAVTFVPAGQSAPTWTPGDFLLTADQAKWYTRNGFVGGMIRYGERKVLRRRKDLTKQQRAEWSSRNHAVGVSADADGTPHLVEALGRGVVRSPTDKYTPVEYVYVHTDLTPEERVDAVIYLEGMVGTKYGFLTDVSIGIAMETGLRIHFSADNRVICSGLVAAMLGIYKWRSDPSHVLPSDLAEYHAVNTWGAAALPAVNS